MGEAEVKATAEKELAEAQKRKENVEAAIYDYDTETLEKNSDIFKGFDFKTALDKSQQDILKAMLDKYMAVFEVDINKKIQSGIRTVEDASGKETQEIFDVYDLGKTDTGNSKMLVVTDKGVSAIELDKEGNQISEVHIPDGKNTILVKDKDDTSAIITGTGVSDPKKMRELIDLSQERASQVNETFNAGPKVSDKNKKLIEAMGVKINPKDMGEFQKITIGKCTNKDGKMQISEVCLVLDENDANKTPLAIGTKSVNAPMKFYYLKEDGSSYISFSENEKGELVQDEKTFQELMEISEKENNIRAERIDKYINRKNIIKEYGNKAIAQAVYAHKQLNHDKNDTQQTNEEPEEERIEEEEIIQEEPGVEATPENNSEHKPTPPRRKSTMSLSTVMEQLEAKCILAKKAEPMYSTKKNITNPSLDLYEDISNAYSRKADNLLMLFTGLSKDTYGYFASNTELSQEDLMKYSSNVFKGILDKEVAIEKQFYGNLLDLIAGRKKLDEIEKHANIEEHKAEAKKFVELKNTDLTPPFSLSKYKELVKDDPEALARLEEIEEYVRSEIEYIEDDYIINMNKYTKGLATGKIPPEFAEFMKKEAPEFSYEAPKIEVPKIEIPKLDVSAILKPIQTHPIINGQPEASIEEPSNEDAPSTNVKQENEVKEPTVVVEEAPTGTDKPPVEGTPQTTAKSSKGKPLTQNLGQEVKAEMLDTVATDTAEHAMEEQIINLNREPGEEIVSE